MVRAFGAFIALGLVAGCITDGNYQAGGLGGPPARPWFGPYGGTYGSYVRPRYDDDQPFRPSRHVVCDPDDRVCYKNGHPDRSETRDFFGKKAARRMD